MFDRLLEETRYLDGEALKTALQDELISIGEEAATPGNRLNDLVTKKC